MKAIVSLGNPATPNVYAEVGMNDRTIVSGRSLTDVMQLAKSYALGRPARVEIFSDIPGGLFAAPQSVYVLDVRGIITAWKG